MWLKSGLFLCEYLFSALDASDQGWFHFVMCSSIPTELCIASIEELWCKTGVSAVDLKFVVFGFVPLGARPGATQLELRRSESRRGPCVSLGSREE